MGCGERLFQLLLKFLHFVHKEGYNEATCDSKRYQKLDQKNKIGKVYDLKYTDIRKAFFMPHHIGCCCTVTI
jgi:hypothetical protein